MKTTTARASAVALLVLALAGCDDADRGRVGVTYADHRLTLPPEFVRDDSAIPIDSKVEVWNAPGAQVATDFGQHGAQPECSAALGPCRIGNGAIDGRPALILRSGPDRGGQWRVHVFVPLHLAEGAGTVRPLSLGMMAHCATQARCDSLVPVLMAADLIAGPPTWEASEAGPPPPPPKPSDQ
ncbi:hypothetical protein EKN06_08765 [Croceicoccus ponticola]|uniref:Uncharacterized protein n=1 Tax=Croceicoccus ponticola TaxID=2217664 RepID=A0A437GXB4_9SPHN|nr:hypothetical protein [Croceicoccus ponticola]RVQ67020.1 hypothetical protein EKN06_08765 [Croceicoccus ponticola]